MEKFNVYQDGKKVAETNETEYLAEGLEPETFYTFEVARVVNGVEGKKARVTARTHVIEPPFNLVAEEVGDRFIDLSWDCDAPLGTAYFNIYVNDEIIDSGFLGRRYTIQKLEPLTDYKIRVTGTRDNEETKGVTINVSTTAPVGDDEPEVPKAEDLDDLLKGDGDFESMGDEGFPLGWTGPDNMKNHVELTSEWVTNGEKGAKFIANKSDMTPILDYETALPEGKYIAIADYKKPEGWNVEVEGIDYNSHDAILAFGEAFIQASDANESIIYALHEVKADEPTFLSVGGRSLDMTGEESHFYFDAVRVYSISDELYNYIKKGNMDRARIAEVFPYTPIDEPAVLDVAQYHTGGGWYELPNGEKVQGKDNAIAALEDLTDE